ncbi:hypothetical protein [Endothiovibrio diazotrophicus]
MTELQLSDDALVNLAPQLARANGEYSRRILGEHAPDPRLEKVLRQLLRMPIDQVPTLLRGAVRVLLDLEQLEEAIDHQRMIETYLDQLLEADAPVALIMGTLGLRRREVRLARKARGMSPRGVKLPQVTPADRERILRAWNALAKAHPVARWLRLKEEYDGAYSLRALYAVLREAGVTS